MKKEYTVNPIGIVHNARTEIEDDNWEESFRSSNWTPINFLKTL